jgi:hypothetical protein
MDAQLAGAIGAPVERVLSALHGVRRGDRGQWIACCPAHDDKKPSLSVRESADGAVLLHCFGGCTVEEIAGALDLEMHDLFPPPEKPANAPKRTPKLLTPSQALELLDEEAQFLAVYGANLAKGVPCTEVDRKRAVRAAGRIAYIRAAAML